MRLRLTFAKTGPLRYTGHLDVHRLWERATRRDGLPLAYSLGFHPQPKIQLASALPLGFSSRCEVLDMWIEQERDPQELPALLHEYLPSGLRILQAQSIDLKAPPLQTQVLSAEYTATLMDEIDIEGLPARLDGLLGAKNLPRERRGKPYDLRPLIEEVRLEERIFSMRLASREGATGRPEAVLEELGLVPEDARIERTRLIFKPESVE